MAYNEGKQLHKGTNKMIGGVCDGIARYFDIDVTIVRLIFAILAVVGVGSGVLIYLIMCLVMPSANDIQRR